MRLLINLFHPLGDSQGIGAGTVGAADHENGVVGVHGSPTNDNGVRRLMVGVRRSNTIFRRIHDEAGKVGAPRYSRPAVTRAECRASTSRSSVALVWRSERPTYSQC